MYLWPRHHGKTVLLLQSLLVLTTHHNSRVTRKPFLINSQRLASLVKQVLTAGTLLYWQVWSKFPEWYKSFSTSISMSYISDRCIWSPFTCTRKFWMESRANKISTDTGRACCLLGLWGLPESFMSPYCEELLYEVLFRASGWCPVVSWAFLHNQWTIVVCTSVLELEVLWTIIHQTSVIVQKNGF